MLDHISRMRNRAGLLWLASQRALTAQSASPESHWMPRWLCIAVFLQPSGGLLSLRLRASG